MPLDTDSPAKRNLGLLPTFTQPPPPPASPPQDPESPQLSPLRPVDQLPAPFTRGPGRAATPTDTSFDGEPASVDKPTAAETTALLVGLLGLAVAGAAFVINRRLGGGRRLREPTPRQTSNVAAPLGRILLRHADISWLNADLADAIKAAAATGAYMNDGPLIEYDAGDAGVPPHLQEDQP